MPKFRDIPDQTQAGDGHHADHGGVLTLLTGIGVVVADTVLVRRDLQNGLVALSEIIADNSTGALAFNDPRSAGETLSALRARPHLLSACIYSPKGELFARYIREGTLAGCAPVHAGKDSRFGPDNVAVSRPIVLNGRPIGTLVLLSDLGEISERMKLDSALLLGVLLASSMIALLLSEKLGAIVAMPISRLVSATTSVAEDQRLQHSRAKVSG